MDANTKVCQSREIDSADLNGEKVMMNLDKGKYFALNLVGSRIWEVIQEEIYIKDIINILLEEYDVDKATCERNVLDYLGVLENEELITVK
ncbi:lasso peptide biosynthesis PqqD family chaperone [Clostridium beijerinckii]|uniref:lasso peptide biosynthesis PqqD family chaperone n=1 Tax=Clostridium beijerinckii TaxID=1520 RepID=UPI00047A8DA4|nr:lasso peptide biosynthesis PqqD family chaperone [Clostridium beijerinckii]